MATVGKAVPVPQDFSDVEESVQASADYNGPVCGAMPAYIRSGFVRKVYFTLGMQLMLTFLIALPFKTILTPEWIAGHVFIAQFCSMGALVITLCMVCCCKDAARTYPTNYIFLFSLTVCISVGVGFVTATYKTQSVLLALSSTAAVFLGLTAYAAKTKSDFTGMGAYLAAALSALIGFSFMMMIFGFFGGVPDFMQTLYALAGTLLFSGYIVYDTQLILGGKHLELGVDDYVFAALNLYLDLINLFLYLLELMGNREDS